MATHPTLRRPIDEFVEHFADWMDHPNPKATVLSSIEYDFRQVAGPLDAEPTLDDAVRRARHKPEFLRLLSRSGARPEAADRVRPQPGGGGQGRARADGST